MELLDEVNEDNVLTGKKYERQYMHENNICHRHVSAWIMNTEGQILMQRRSFSKKKNPGKFAKTGGHVDSGETPEKAIQREIFEEIGLEVKENQIQILDIYKSKSKKEKFFGYNFIFITNKLEKEFILQKEEVEEVKYFTIEELEKAKKDNNNEFTFYKWDYDDFCSQMNMLKDFRKKLCNIKKG